MNTLFYHLLSCPNCFGQLQERSGRKLYFRCVNCRKNYPIKNKRPIFTDLFEPLRGKLPKNPGIIRERLHPRLYDYAFIATNKVMPVITKFAQQVNQQVNQQTILDVGCGYKPFYPLFSKRNLYIGIDISQNSFADVIADNHRLPFKDNSFDAVIVSEVLEHTADEYQFIKELRRVCKNKAIVYLSLPFIFPLHGIPHDYQRFTKYKLLDLFNQDKILSMSESNTVFASLFIYLNCLLTIIFNSSKTLRPIYVIDNILGIICEKLTQMYFKLRGRIVEYWQYALVSFPMSYSMIIQINKKHSIWRR